MAKQIKKNDDPDFKLGGGLLPIFARTTECSNKKKGKRFNKKRWKLKKTIPYFY
jgi:hypothetical protein